MKETLIIAGFGGQGVLSMGKILAYSGVMQGCEVTWMPSYGPEMRGGTANVTVILSDRRISSPIAGEFDSAIILNQQSMDKFESKVKAGGVLIYDTNGIAHPHRHRDIRHRRGRGVRPNGAGQDVQHHDSGRLPQSEAHSRHGQRHDGAQEVLARTGLAHVAAERGSDSPRRRNNPKNKINAVRQCDVAALRFSPRRGECRRGLARLRRVVLSFRYQTARIWQDGAVFVTLRRIDKIFLFNVPTSYRWKSNPDGRLPAAIGRVYRSDPPRNPLLGGDFGRYAPDMGL